MTRWAALDVETTGLDPAWHTPWEIAAVCEDGTEHVWCWRPSDYVLARAQDQALDVSGFHHRAPQVRDPAAEGAAAREVAELLDGRTLIANNATFDAAMLTALLRDWGRVTTWHYRPVCVASMAAGWLHRHATATDWHDIHQRLARPWSSEALSRACGVLPPADHERHTALGDARWVARWWLTLTGQEPAW